MQEVVLFGLRLLAHVRSVAKHSDFEILNYSRNGQLAFIKMALGEDCRSEISKLPSHSERANLLHWYYLRRLPAASFCEGFQHARSIEEHLRAFEEAIVQSTEYRKVGRISKSETAFSSSATHRNSNVLIDVSNTINSGARSGIQRVVRELSKRLILGSDYSVIYFDMDRRVHVALSPELIDATPSQINGEPITFQEGDIYFDPDASWGEPLNKYGFYRELKERGIRIVTMHYDAVPLLFPHFSHANTVGRYIEHFLAVATFADRVICNSRAVQKDFEQLCRALTYRTPPNSVVPLGGDFSFKSVEPKLLDAADEIISNQKFALCVGTVEPRKNYAAVLKILPQLQNFGLRLVIVGKPGWESKDLLDSLAFKAKNRGEVVWLADADDACVDKLYRNCEFLIVASHYEGYGLPIVEGLSRGCVVISSDGGSLPEVLGDRGVIFSLANPEGLNEAIEKLLTDTGLKQLLKERASEYVPRTWADVAADTRLALADLLHPKFEELASDSIQLVYISIRPEGLKKSLGSFKKYFRGKIESVLVLTKSLYLEEMRTAIANEVPGAIVLCDENIASKLEITDHAERNYRLREALYCSDYTKAIFLALDDDSILLREMSLDRYIEGKRVNAFLSYPSLRGWHASPFATSSYDDSIWKTGDILSQFAFPEGTYSAHQPQLIVKKIAIEIFEEFKSLENKKFDEWSLIFNVASFRYRELFRTIRATSLFWPQNYSSWLPYWFNDDIYFENFSPDTYQAGGIGFSYGLKEDHDWRIKAAVYALEYNKYYFQRVLDTQLTSEPLSIVDDGESVTFKGGTAVAIAGLWKSIRADCRTRVARYEVCSQNKTIVDGRDMQTISRNRPFHVKVPADAGIYDLYLQDDKGEILAQTKLIVLPIASGAIAL